MGKNHGAERRKNPRVQLGVRVDVVSGSNFYSAHGRDISMGGLYIETHVPIPLGTRIMVELVLERSRHVLPAEVMWSTENEAGSSFGVGVQFDGLSSRSKHAIERFMRSRAPFVFAFEEPDAPAIDVVREAAGAEDRGGWPELRARSPRTATPGCGSWSQRSGRRSRPSAPLRRTPAPGRRTASVPY